MRHKRNVKRSLIQCFLILLCLGVILWVFKDTSTSGNKLNSTQVQSLTPLIIKSDNHPLDFSDIFVVFWALVHGSDITREELCSFLSAVKIKKDVVKNSKDINLFLKFWITTYLSSDDSNEYLSLKDVVKDKDFHSLMAILHILIDAKLVEKPVLRWFLVECMQKRK